MLRPRIRNEHAIWVNGIVIPIDYKVTKLPDKFRVSTSILIDRSDGEHEFKSEADDVQSCYDNLVNQLELHGGFKLKTMYFEQRKYADERQTP